MCSVCNNDLTPVAFEIVGNSVWSWGFCENRNCEKYEELE